MIKQIKIVCRIKISPIINGCFIIMNIRDMNIIKNLIKYIILKKNLFIIYKIIIFTLNY